MDDERIIMLHMRSRRAAWWWRIRTIRSRRRQSRDWGAALPAVEKYRTGALGPARSKLAADLTVTSEPRCKCTYIGEAPSPGCPVHDPPTPTDEGESE